MKNKLTYISGVIAMCMLPGLLFSQHASHKKHYTFEKIETRTPWLVSGNGAGLVYNKAQNFATLAGYFSNESGDYRNFNTPESYSNFGIVTRSYNKVGKVFFYGSFNYDYGINQNLTWNGTVYPNATLNPIVDSFPGKVLRESYILNGKVGYELNDLFAIGAAFDYNTSTMAKRTDGRNANTLSMMNVSPGISFRSGAISLGMNLFYKRDAEKVEYSFIGDETGKKIYYMEGLFFFTETGLASTTILDRIYHKDIFGGSFQAQYRTGNLCIFNEFSVDLGHENDYDGDSYSKRYAYTDILKYKYDGRFQYKGNGADHILSLSFLSDENASYYVVNSYEQIPEELNNYRYFEYGKVLRYMTNYQKYGAEYKTFIRDGEWKCSWILAAGVNRQIVEKDYRLYPAQYQQEITVDNAYLRVNKDFEIGDNSLFNLDLNGSYSTGKGDALDVKNPITAGSLRQNTNLLYTDFNYNTAEIISAGIGARYTRIMDSQKGRALYVGAAYKHYDAGDLGTRGVISLSLGMNF